MQGGGYGQPPAPHGYPQNHYPGGYPPHQYPPYGYGGPPPGAPPPPYYSGYGAQGGYGGYPGPGGPGGAPGPGGYSYANPYGGGAGMHGQQPQQPQQQQQQPQMGGLGGGGGGPAGGGNDPGQQQGQEMIGGQQQQQKGSGMVKTDSHAVLMELFARDQEVRAFEGGRRVVNVSANSNTPLFRLSRCLFAARETGRRAHRPGDSGEGWQHGAASAAVTAPKLKWRGTGESIARREDSITTRGDPRPANFVV